MDIVDHRKKCRGNHLELLGHLIPGMWVELPEGDIVQIIRTEVIQSGADNIWVQGAESGYARAADTLVTRLEVELHIVGEGRA